MRFRSAEAAFAFYQKVKSEYDIVKAAALRDQILFALIEENGIKQQAHCACLLPFRSAANIS
jgi:hypothetical protein